MVSRTRRIASHKEAIRVAVCDLGTFSGLFLIAEVRTRRLEPLLEERRTVNLTYVSPESRHVPREAVARAVDALRRFDGHVARSGCRRAAVVCTAAIRHASNRGAVVARLRQATSHPVVVLSPCAEGLLTAAGALGGLRGAHRFTLVVDVGGGSTEVTDLKTRRIWRIPTGAAWASRQWQQGCPRSRDRRADYFRRQASKWVHALRPGRFTETPRIVGVGGTITTLAALRAGLTQFDPSQLHGMVLTRAWTTRMANQVAAMSHAALRALVPFDRDRARVLTAGTFLWEAVLNRIDVARVTVSVRGLRWGVAEYLAAPGGQAKRLMPLPALKPLDPPCGNDEIGRPEGDLTT